MPLEVYFVSDIRRALRAAYLARRDSLEPGYVHALRVLAEAFGVSWEDVVNVETLLKSVYRLVDGIDDGQGTKVPPTP